MTPFLLSFGFVALFLWTGCANTSKKDAPNATGQGDETSSLLPADSLSGDGETGKPSKSSDSLSNQPNDNHTSPVPSGSRLPVPIKKETAPTLAGEGFSDQESPKDELVESSDILTDPVQEEPDDYGDEKQSSKVYEDSPSGRTAKNDPALASPSYPRVIEKGPEPLDPLIDKVVSDEPSPVSEKYSVPESGPSVDSFFNPVPSTKDLSGPNGIPFHEHTADDSPAVNQDPSARSSSNDLGDESGLPSDSRTSVEVPRATFLENPSPGNDSNIVLRPSATDENEDMITRSIHLSDTAPETASVLASSLDGKRLSLSRNRGPVDIPLINPSKAVDFSARVIQAQESGENEAVPRVGFLDPSGNTTGQEEALKAIGFSDKANSAGLLRPPSLNDLDGVPLKTERDSRPTYDSLRRLFDGGKKGESRIPPNQRSVRDFSGIEELLKARAEGNVESPSSIGEDAQDGARYQNALQWLRSRGLTESGKNVD